MGNLVEEALEMLSQMAEKLKLDEDETNSFIESGMERQGFKKTFTWADPEPEGGGSGGDFFSRKREERTRPVGKNGPGWQYGS